MKKILLIVLIIFFSLSAETLFEIKDASDNPVFSISDDGMRVINSGDTMMVITAAEAKINLDNSKDKALSRSFSVTTSTTGKAGLANMLEVTTDNTIMREGVLGDEYTNFSPENIFVGLRSGANTVPNISLDEGMDNVFLGNNSGVTNYKGSCNVFIGKDAGNKNYGDGTYLNGEYNVFMGHTAGYENISGSCNVFLGKEAGKLNQDGYHNIYIGTETGRDNTNGTGNTCIGSDSFYGGSGSYNTYLGYLSGGLASGSRNIFIGYNVGYNETGSYKLFIDDSDTSTPLIYGEFDNDLVTINGKLGVGVSPSYKFHSVDVTTWDDYAAVYGNHTVTDNYGVGVEGSGGYMGVVGSNSCSVGTGYGIWGESLGAGTGTRIGVYGYAVGGDTQWAGYFDGDLNVVGTVVKSADKIQIDHPDDPQNKILSHSTIISDRMMNIYNGNVVLDSDGKAEVTMPDWFDSFNTDVRYQLTAIGSAAPSLHISKEMNDGVFSIAGGKSNMKVSWEITGIRNDNYAKENPVQAVKEKSSSEKGYYLNPEAYGLAREKGIDRQSRRKELTK